jgi:hypothetical protein
MSRDHLCPHCDSPNVRPMPLRAHEQESAVLWHECANCGRMWSVRKNPADDPTTHNDA